MVTARGRARKARRVVKEAYYEEVVGRRQKAACRATCFVDVDDLLELRRVHPANVSAASEV